MLRARNIAPSKPPPVETVVTEAQAVSSASASASGLVPRKRKASEVKEEEEIMSQRLTQKMRKTKEKRLSYRSVTVRILVKLIW